MILYETADEAVLLLQAELKVWKHYCRPGLTAQWKLLDNDTRMCCGLSAE
jgi:hypothetical protein